MATLFEVDFVDRALIAKNELGEPTALEEALERLRKSVVARNNNRWQKLRDDDRWSASFDVVCNELWLTRRGFGTTSCFHVSSFGDPTCRALVDHKGKALADLRERGEHLKEVMALLPKLSAFIKCRGARDG
ncbi:MAG: hypothetical protein AAB388_01470 [Patescibacteria group bacterium]